jgi:hypothetical protein
MLSQEIQQRFEEMCNVPASGAIIRVEMPQMNASLSQMLHLVEQNDARLLNIFSFVEDDKVVVLLKIDMEDASPVVRSLERFDYPVKQFVQKQSQADDRTSTRLSELMYYLEM